MSKQARGDQTVARVLDAALAAFAAGGGSVVPSVQEICERSGVSVGSVYHHFGSRDGVVVALYRRSLLELLDAVRDAGLRARSPRGMVRSTIDAYLDWVEGNPDAARFLLGSSHAELHPEASPELQHEKLERVGPLVERALRHAAAGEIATLPQEYYELVVLGPVAETARRWLMGAPLDLGEARTVLARTAWRALGPEVEG